MRRAGVARAKADTIKTPIARSFTPVGTEIGANGWHWDRQSMFASGALTVGDLLAMVPGVTSLTTGFILAPQVAAWNGDPGRVRLFVDGVELDAAGPRNGGITDLASIPLWSLEDVAVERGAGELRVYLRTWRVRRTTPSTRTDILTGTENLNLYRGYFGKRMANGVALQVAAQQLSTISRPGLDGDALGWMGRVGWAKGNWSVDATAVRQGEDRNPGIRFITTTPQANALPAFKGSQGVAYVRLGWRDPQIGGPWLQLIASSVSATVSHAASTTGVSSPVGTGSTATADSVDSAAVRTQYVAAAGITRWGLRLSTIDRLRPVNGKAIFSPSARVEYESPLFTVTAGGERSVDSTTRTDVLARLTPFHWFNVGAAMSRSAPNRAALGAPTTWTRLEGALRIRGRWISGGMVHKEASMIAAPVELDTTLRPVASPAATGTIASFRGPIWRGWSLDVDMIEWSAVGPYRPQTQTRTRLWFASGFLDRFPRGNFHLSAALTHEFRSATWVPSGATPLGQTTPGATVLGTLLEIRIASAVISWQYRNMTGQIYETYPGYLMPRLVNIYGVRWEFWN